MEEEFVPYELALELKELGFDEPCIQFYYKSGTLNNSVATYGFKNWNFDNGHLNAPLYQQVFDWFRRVYDYEYRIVKAGETYFYEIDNTKPFFERLEGELLDMQSGWIYKTYEEARLECLKKLIEIVK